MPTIRDETCLKATDSTLTVTLTDFGPTSTFVKHSAADEGDFSSANVPAWSVLMVEFSILINDLRLDLMSSQRWCTSFTENFEKQKIIKGFVYNNRGLGSLRFNDKMLSLPFIMPEY